MQALVVSLEKEDESEAPQDRLRNNHPALAGGRRDHRCLCHRASYRNRDARPNLAQLAGCGVAARQCLGTAYGSAVVLTAVSIGYALYLIKSGLTRRVVLDKIRLRGLIGRKQARLGSLSVLLVWTFSPRC